MKNKIIFYLILFFSILNILDFITALFILDGESNPIFIFTGSIIPLIIIKILVIFVVFKVYKNNEYKTRFLYYTFIYLLVVGSLLFLTGVVSNVYGALNPSIVEESAQLTSTQKINYYSYVVGIIMLIPLSLALISFKLYDISEKYVRYKK